VTAAQTEAQRCGKIERIDWGFLVGPKTNIDMFTNDRFKTKHKVYFLE